MLTNKKLAHTSGPWFWSGSFLMGKGAEFGSTHILELGTMIRPDEADCKLIAAAPELLEALKKVEQWIAEDSVSPTMHLSTIREKFIKPAILKATS